MIAINDVDMPRSCDDCMFCRYTGLDYYCCDLTTYSVNSEADERDSKCPLIDLTSLESITNDLVPRKVVERIIKSPRTQEQMLLMLNSVPSAISQDPRWIPVSERLPEKNMECLVAVGKFNLTKMAMYSDLMGTIDHKIFYQGDVRHDNFEDITEYVKAWMPLPKAYSEVEE